jgi:ABC-type transport system involved in multi-copper enzyme maturation permease subunit
MSLIPDEVERRTIYPIVAKPVRRSEFIIGKFLGVLLPVAISMGVMLLVLEVTLLAVERPEWQTAIIASVAGATVLGLAGMLIGSSSPIARGLLLAVGATVIAVLAGLAIGFKAWSWVIVLAVALMLFAMTVLAGVVLLISTRTSTIIAALVGVVVFALGFNMGRLYHLAEPAHAGSKLHSIALGVLAAVLPNLSMFDLRVEAASPPQYYSWAHLWSLFGNGVLYAVGYLAVLLIASALLFSKREV